MFNSYVNYQRVTPHKKIWFNGSVVIRLALIVGHRHNHFPSLPVGCQSERRNIGALRYLSESKLDVATSWNTHELARYSTLLNVIGWISTSLLLPFVSSPTSSSSSSSPSRSFSIKDSEHGNGYDPMALCWTEKVDFAKTKSLKAQLVRKNHQNKNRHRTRKNNTQKKRFKTSIFLSFFLCETLHSLCCWTHKAMGCVLQNCSRFFSVPVIFNSHISSPKFKCRFSWFLLVFYCRCQQHKYILVYIVCRCIRTVSM